MSPRPTPQALVLIHWQICLTTLMACIVYGPDHGTASEGCCCLSSTCFYTKGLAVSSAALAAAAGDYMTSVHTWSSGTAQQDVSRIKQAVVSSMVYFLASHQVDAERSSTFFPLSHASIPLTYLLSAHSSVHGNKLSKELKSCSG